MDSHWWSECLLTYSETATTMFSSQPANQPTDHSQKQPETPTLTYSETAATDLWGSWNKEVDLGASGKRPNLFKLQIAVVVIILKDLRLNSKD